MRRQFCFEIPREIALSDDVCLQVVVRREEGQNDEDQEEEEERRSGPLSDADTDKDYVREWLEASPFELDLNVSRRYFQLVDDARVMFRRENHGTLLSDGMKIRRWSIGC